MCLLISCAIIVPWFFPQISNDDETGWLTLTYRVNEHIARNGTSLQNTEQIYNLTYVASRNNMEIVLSFQYFYGYPIVKNVSSWEMNDEVEIGTQMAVLANVFRIGGYDCWYCKFDETNSIFYDTKTGFFIEANLTTIESGTYETQETYRLVQLENVNHEIPGEGYPTQDGVLLSGIFIELAIVVWLVPNRSKKKS